MAAPVHSTPSHRRRELLVCLALVLCTLAVYWPIQGHGFLNLDDGAYVSQNAHVRAGLTWSSIRWAFTTGYFSYWHPLTWLSHMLDYQLFALDPAGHHATSIQLHTAAVLLLFLLLRQTTGSLWRSAFAAAFFALHPLRVESVAWISERKDVLSALLWMLTMLAYVWYAKRPSILRYAALLLSFALGLMAKPMLVTLPFVLLLFDYWPLRRIGKTSEESPTKPAPAKILLLEKVPLFILAAASAIITLAITTRSGAAPSLTRHSLQARIALSLVAYVKYVAMILWPHDLAILYPHPSAPFPWWQVAAAAFFLGGMTLLAAFAARRHGYLPVGWLWFLVTLVPVIGVVQVGTQFVADRWTYIPSVGIGIMIVWGLADLASRSPVLKRSLAAVGVVALVASAAATEVQIYRWRDNEALFRQTVRVTENNVLAHTNLAQALIEKGKVDEAIEHCAEALRIKPDYEQAVNNLGVALFMKRELRPAKALFRRVIEINPSQVEAYNNLGRVLVEEHKATEAVSVYETALRIQPNHVGALIGLADALCQAREYEPAIARYAAALDLDPGRGDALRGIAHALAELGRFDEAAAHCMKALELDPADVEARYYLGVALARLGATADAMECLQQVLTLVPDHKAARQWLSLLESGEELPQGAVSRTKPPAP